MSEKSPAFQFYPKDWLSDARVRAMGREARGVYIDLLAIYWNEGGLSSDTKVLARVAVVPQRTFDRLWPLIAPCFELNGVTLTSKRLDREKVKQAAYKSAQALKGQKSAKSRASNKEIQPRLESGSTSVESRLEPKVNFPFPSPSASTLKPESVESPMPIPPGVRGDDEIDELNAIWAERRGGPHRYIHECLPVVRAIGFEKAKACLINYLDAKVNDKFKGAPADFAANYRMYMPKSKTDGPRHRTAAELEALEMKAAGL